MQSLILGMSAKTDTSTEPQNKTGSAPTDPAEPTGASTEKSLRNDNRGILSEVRLIGAGLVMTLIITLVLTEVYNAVDISSGPFSDVVTTLETTGASALTLLVVGFLVVAATAIMRFFGGGMMGGGR